MTEQSLAALAGHDAWAAAQIDRLLDAYRRGGITGARMTAADIVAHVTEDQEADLLAEAALTISERTGTSSANRRRDWAAFYADEVRTEDEATRKGGNR